MDIQVLRQLTQAVDVKQLKDNTVAMTATLKQAGIPPNQAARWGMFMLALTGACVIEGWVAHDINSEKDSPCRELVIEWCSFCSRAATARWFVDDAGLVDLMEKVLLLEAQRLHENGWEKESYEHSYLFRLKEYAFEDRSIEGSMIFNLPVTPEG